MSFYTNREIFHVPGWVLDIWSENYFVEKSAALKIQCVYKKYIEKIRFRKLLQKSYFRKSYRNPKNIRKRRVKKSQMRWYETGDGRGTLQQAFECARKNKMYCFTFVTVTGKSQKWQYGRGKKKKKYLKEWRLMREFN